MGRTCGIGERTLSRKDIVQFGLWRLFKLAQKVSDVDTIKKKKQNERSFRKSLGMPFTGAGFAICGAGDPAGFSSANLPDSLSFEKS